MNSGDSLIIYAGKKDNRNSYVNQKQNCFLPSFATCKCKFMSFSQTAATNEAWANISCEYVIVSPSCSPFTC